MKLCSCRPLWQYVPLSALIKKWPAVRAITADVSILKYRYISYRIITTLKHRSKQNLQTRPGAKKKKKRPVRKCHFTADKSDHPLMSHMYRLRRKWPRFWAELVSKKMDTAPIMLNECENNRRCTKRPSCDNCDSLCMELCHREPVQAENQLQRKCIWMEFFFFF